MKALLAILVVGLLSCSPSSQMGRTQSSPDPAQLEQRDLIDDRVDQLMARMTLTEKVGQMNQYNGFMDFTGPQPAGGDAANKYKHLREGRVGSMLNVTGADNVRALQKIAVEETRLGIPLLIGFDVIHGFQTQSPIPLAESASWDLEAIEKSARMAAIEATSAGINWTFAPMVDISRDARWGRVMEGAGEDPYLGSKIAVARVNGFQGDDLSDRTTLLATAKHFAAYGLAESGRDYNTVDVGANTMNNIVLPPFKAASDAGVRTFMNAFNEINGIPATAHQELVMGTLKKDWNFKGFVVSDWGSITEMQAHGYAPSGTEAARMAVHAGSDMDMESHLYINELEQLVLQHKVSMAQVDDAVRRILRTKFELGLFDDPYKYTDAAYEATIRDSQQMHDASLDMAKKSIVLLKNDNDLLPLPKSGKKIAVIGALAGDKNSPLGSWRIAAVDDSAVSLLEGLKAYPDNDYQIKLGPKLIDGPAQFITEIKINATDRSGFDDAVSAATNADIVVMMLGEPGFMSGEGRSRVNLGLPGLQQELLEAVHERNKNIVLILENGRPLTLPWADEHVPAILETWHLGSQSGHAIAQTLFGDNNPSGKLPMSFPRNVGQVPIYYNYKNTGRPSLPGPDVVFWSHYQDEENTPLYPFGHGLSYSSFTYDNLEVVSRFRESGTVHVSVQVTNTSDLPGEEVVQLYIKDEFASVTRPVKELKGFEKILVAPGQSQTVRFELTSLELGFYDNQGNWLVEDGSFLIGVGGSSDIELSERIMLAQ